MKENTYWMLMTLGCAGLAMVFLLAGLTLMGVVMVFVECYCIGRLFIS